MLAPIDGDSVFYGKTVTPSRWRLSIITRKDSRMPRKLKPVHPGEVLREEFLRPLNLSANKLALDIRVPVTRIGEIVNGRRAITSDTAIRLGIYFNTSPQFWMNLQMKYDLDVTSDKELANIEHDVRPFAAATRARRGAQDQGFRDAIDLSAKSSV
jgi:addiction module HigA family antidote